MRSSKWIKNVEPDQRVSDVANQALSIRLKIVYHYLNLSALKADKDIEHVHQLRVSTRRAQATLRSFADVLPKRRAAWFGKRLKRIRRVAGTARDLDVLCERLMHYESRHQDDCLQGIIGSLQRQRRQAQKPLTRIWKRTKKDRFRGKISELSDCIRWRGEGSEPTFHAVAIANLRPDVDAFFTAGQNDLTIDENLHRLRLAGKKLRYSIELHSAAFDSSLKREVYPVFAEIQESLGDINDHVVAKSIFEGWLVQSNDDHATQTIASLIGVERDAHLQAHNRFYEWWTPETVSRLKQQFDALLDGDDPSTSAIAHPA